MNLEEKYLFFKKGEFFFSRRYGAGQVIHLNIENNKITIDFKDKILEFEIDTETQYLKKISPSSYLARKYVDAEGEKNRIRENPREVLREILLEYKKISEEEIKNLLSDVVAEEFLSWWKKQRAYLKKEKDIKISGGKIKFFEIIEEEEMEEEYILQFEKGDVHQKFKVIESIKSKGLPLREVLIKKLKEEINTFKKVEKYEVIFYLVDIKEMSQDELYRTLQDKSMDELWDIMLSIRSNKYKKMLFDYILRSRKKEEQIFLLAEKNLDSELFEYFLKQRENIISEIFDYFWENYKKYPEHYLWLLRYLINKSPSFLKDKNIWENVLWILYNFKDLRKYNEIISNFNEDGISKIKEGNALTYQEYVEEIFENNKNVKFNIKRNLQRTYPHLLFYEKETICSTSASILKKEEELNYIKLVEIPQNAKAIARARAEGDLSENFEYQAAKDKHNFLFSKVRQITYELQNAIAVEDFDGNSDRITLGSKVILKNEEEVRDFTILGIWDSNPTEGIISYRSAVANLLLGKRVGDIVVIEGKNYQISEFFKIRLDLTPEVSDKEMAEIEKKYKKPDKNIVCSEEIEI